jgi:hypothetical protein
MIMVVQIAVDALFVAAVGQVEMHIQWNAQLQRALAHLLHQVH